MTQDGTASFAGIYSGNENTGLCLVAASYLDGRLYDVKYSSVDNIAAARYVNLSVNIDIPENGAAKCFLLDSLHGLRPVNVKE